DVLLAPHQSEPPASVELAEVPRVEPTIRVDRLARRLLVVGVADHHVRPPCEDLSDTVPIRLIDAELHPRDRLSDSARARAGPAGRHSEHRCRFRQAIALAEMKAEPLEQGVRLRGQGSATADQEAQMTAESLVDRTEQGPPQIQSGLLRDESADLDRGIECPLGQDALFRYTRQNAPLQHLPKSWHSNQGV